MTWDERPIAVIVGPRTTVQLDGLLAGVEIVLADDVQDRIDDIVPPDVT
ncbi:hypothetical protein [Ancylobacter novellus]|nr:hypothetical protein [Ancylobacter novellus]